MQTPVQAADKTQPQQIPEIPIPYEPLYLEAVPLNQIHDLMKFVHGIQRLLCVRWMFVREKFPAKRACRDPPPQVVKREVASCVGNGNQNATPRTEDSDHFFETSFGLYEMFKCFGAQHQIHALALKGKVNAEICPDEPDAVAPKTRTWNDNVRPEKLSTRPTIRDLL